MNGRTLRFIYLLGLIALCGWAQSPKEESATVITAEKLTFKAKERIAEFETNVLVTDPEMQLAADRLTVQFDEKGQPEFIKAVGRVTITQADRSAQADMATYDVKAGKIVLTGRAQISRGRDLLQGEVITYWRFEDRMVCQPGARLVIYSEKGGLSGR